MRGTGVTGSRAHARLVQKENSTDSVPMMVQQELSLSSALFASLGQSEAWEGTGQKLRWGLPAWGEPTECLRFPPSEFPAQALRVYLPCDLGQDPSDLSELNKFAGQTGF